MDPESLGGDFEKIEESLLLENFAWVRTSIGRKREKTEERRERVWQLYVKILRYWDLLV